ncbi:MAG: hypothetical protein ACHREM_02170 [Polyangiales bacterium]
MAKEALYIPEDDLLDVIAIIRAGLKATAGKRVGRKEARAGLVTWCKEEEAYMKRLASDH